MPCFLAGLLGNGLPALFVVCCVFVVAGDPLRLPIVWVFKFPVSVAVFLTCRQAICFLFVGTTRSFNSVLTHVSEVDLEFSAKAMDLTTPQGFVCWTWLFAVF